MAFADWQFQLDGLDFGTGTPYRVSEIDAGKPDVRVQDADMPFEDGLRMGRDFMSGTLLSVSLGVEGVDAEQAMDRLASLRYVWNGGGVRNQPGAVSQLLYQRPGSGERVMFGRPRKFTPATMFNAVVGWIPVEADFQAVDDVFYSREVHSLTISGSAIDYQGTAGTTTPHVPPVTLAEATLPSDVATNAGNADTWPVITFHGPRAQPGVTWVNQNRSLSLAVVLGDGETVTVDTYPWARTVLRSDGASFAGDLRGSRLADLALPPGDTQIAFDGTDSTLTSSVDISWRDANSSL